ncbi:hypothetical protein F5Y18DRAFT_30527 [Xylariaceae sp. FL1019]|nr:hypothetical protein F5Y18DRAFT_30527 [Xylariaceae sp. FL1019]
MGFWSSLVNGAAQVGGFLVNNAGSIATVAGTIAKVAALVVLEDDHLFEADDDSEHNILPKLHYNIQKAQKVMAKEASERFKAPSDGDDNASTSSTTTGPFDLPAIWPSPPVIATGGAVRIPPSMSADINRFLVLNKIPTVVSGVDVGQSIAEQMFSGFERHFVVHDPSQLSGAPITVTQPGGISITGGHIYYKIPLGNPGGNNTWHSSLRLFCKVPDSEMKSIREERKKNSIPVIKSTVKPNEPFNQTTISVTWNGTKDTDALTAKAVSKLVEDASGDITYVAPPYKDGSKYKYQFKSSTETGPGEVMAAFSTALGSVIPKVKDTPPMMPNLKISQMATLLPAVEK